MAAAPIAALSERLGALGRAWPLVAAVSPLNWSSELARLAAARAAGQPAVARFVYPANRPDRDLPARLLDLGAALDDEDDPAAAGLARRARELALELGLILSVETGDFVPLARLRFASSSDDDTRALGWATLPVAEAPAAAHRSDDEGDPGSLVAQVRAALAEHALPGRVVLRDDLPSLAACGDGTVLIARGRMTSADTARRTALHEVAGHLRPWWERQNGRRLADRDRGESDLEEGHAIWLEQAAGLLDDRRRQELGRRHVAACLAHDGASLDAITDHMEALGSQPADALRLAARARRGGGLGRERVYLPSLWKIEAGG